MAASRSLVTRLISFDAGLDQPTRQLSARGGREWRLSVRQVDAPSRFAMSDRNGRGTFPVAKLPQWCENCTAHQSVIWDETP